MIEMYRDVNDSWRFRIKAANHKILAHSEAYEKKQGCLNGIRSLLENVGVKNPADVMEKINEIERREDV
jgi:uncharacterized protein YegP (UPF0339 family)